MSRRFGWFNRKRGEKAADPTVAFTAQLVEALRLFDGTLVAYGNVYRKLQPVRTVVDFIADAVATTPLKVYRRVESGRPEARDHPVAELIRSPNPDLTTRRLIWGTVADVAIYGNAYWRKVRGPRDQRSLVPLPPFRVTPRGGDLLRPEVYDFFPPNGAVPRRFSADEVCHFHLYDPEDRRIGSSKLEALKAILAEEVEASKHRAGYWANATRTGGWIEYPLEAGKLGDDQLKRVRESLQATHAGSHNAGKTGILELGGHFNADGFSPKDSEFINGRLFVLEATAREFNLPLSLLGLTQTATYASQREFRKQLYTEVLPPWFELIQSEIELQVFPWFTRTEDLYTEFVVESKLRGDFVDQAEIVFKATGRPYMTVHEARDLFNMDNRGDPSDDLLAIPTNNIALGSTPVEPEPLAAVASMPTGKIASALTDFFTHQERSVLSRLGAGKAFEHARWNRALTPIVGSVSLAERINLETAIRLQETEDARAVFEEARNLRVPAIAHEVAQTKEAVQ